MIWGLFLAIRHYWVIIRDEKYYVDNDRHQQLDHFHQGALRGANSAQLHEGCVLLSAPTFPISCHFHQQLVILTITNVQYVLSFFYQSANKILAQKYCIEIILLEALKVIL